MKMIIKTKIGTIAASKKTLRVLALHISVAGQELRRIGCHSLGGEADKISKDVYDALYAKSEHKRITCKGKNVMTVQTPIGSIASSKSALNTIVLYLHQAATYYETVEFYQAASETSDLADIIFDMLDGTGYYK